ncbi:sorting nexin-29 [Scaptodrosophila lebanonensis]|uniref:Sorting nexin-29 n=1 Tax=Drosophila lebanonensis TaxID=7225 RepID=A0A6J2U757_DROLE|nr:sorting nexin-29 [Scaptodrosophila lebanonensis]
MPENALPEPTRASLSGSTFGQRREDIFQRLQQSAQLTSQTYSGKRELATDQDDNVQELCEALEQTFSYGLRQQPGANTLTAASILQNMHEIVTGVSGSRNNNNDSSFWDFCQTQLTPHERQRYEQLNQIWTKQGRGRAFIRASLNEKRLQNHVLTWLSDEALLHRYFTPWSLLLNEEAVRKLPEILDSLKDVLFALNVDTTELNAPKRMPSSAPVKDEPIIYAPNPVPVATRTQKRTVGAIERPIAGGNSTEDLLSAINTKVEQLTVSDNAIEQRIPYTSAYTTPCDPIEPELEFLNTPLPEVYPASEEQTKNSGAVANDAGDDELYEERSDTSSQYSKSSSLTNCTESQQITALEQQLGVLTDRCALLETRVAELSLQNRQLVRRLTLQFNATGIDPTSSFLANFLITIPQVKLIKPQRSSAYYTYEINITMRQRLEHWTLFRRYREFYKLHKSLLRTHPSIAAIEFPRKKHFGNMNLVFVEERRQQLQIYLLNLLETLPLVEACKSKEDLQKVFPFFRETFR